ncbi:MAG: hypothetical protein AB1390_09915 [Nitrospirota bacterium]
MEHVKKHIGAEFANSIVWELLALPPRHSSFYKRLGSDIRTTRFLLNKLNQDPANHVLVITGNSSILWVLKFFVNTIHGDKKIQVIFHGTLAALGSRRSLRPHKRICDMRVSLKRFNHRRIQYIVLEESIRDAVLQELPFLKDHIFVLDIPIPLDEEAKGTDNFSSPIQFGFLGLANEHKGFSKYLAVAEEISTKFPGLAEFHVVGRLGNQYRNLDIPGIAFLKDRPGVERLSRDEYTQRLSELNFVCFFCEDRYYKFSASAVLLDSIAWEKPIIAPRMPIFKNLERKFGDIGYLCENGDFSKVIGTILKEMDSDRYKRQVLNMRAAKNSRTPESLARKYRELVERFKS